jgi:glycosyltransferase involved in cell wall biosynthesis
VKDEFVVLFVAVLEPRKAGTLAIRAFHRLAQARKAAVLVMIGQGPEQARLAELVHELGLRDQVRFLSGLKRSEVMGWMQVARIFLLPSLRDSAGFVFLEAMLAGKPVVCLDLGGPGELVGADCGLKIQPTTPEQVVAELAAALERLAGNPALCQTLGAAGRRRVQELYDWDKKGELMSGFYHLSARTR